MAKRDFDELMSVGVDIGVDVFHLVGFDKDGQLVLRKKIKRMALVATFEELALRRGYGSLHERALCQPYAAQVGV